MLTRRKGFRRKVGVLAGVIFIAAAYCGVLFAAHTFTGHPLVDGTLGIVIGLYICSHPAANVIDLLFSQRSSRSQPTSGWPGLGWLSLNMLALLLAWLTIATGASRLAVRTG